MGDHADDEYNANWVFTHLGSPQFFHEKKPMRFYFSKSRVNPCSSWSSNTGNSIFPAVFRFSVAQGFLKMIQEVHDMAGQHETISENLTTSIIREVHAMLQDLKQERKKVSEWNVSLVPKTFLVCVTIPRRYLLIFTNRTTKRQTFHEAFFFQYLQDGAKQMNILQSQLTQLERVSFQSRFLFQAFIDTNSTHLFLLTRKALLEVVIMSSFLCVCGHTCMKNNVVFFFQSKKQYEKAFRDSERAQEMYKKADADINLSRADVEKVKPSRPHMPFDIFSKQKNQLTILFCSQRKAENLN